MAAYYLWFKGVHIIFMVTWFAGLFYLPRLFIYHAGTADAPGHERFVVMERRLFAITTIGAVLTFVFGILLLIANPAVLHTGWFVAKLAGVAALVIYQVRCLGWMRRLRDGYRSADTTWLRWFNEIPVLFLFAIVLLAVIKPF